MEQRTEKVVAGARMVSRFLQAVWETAQQEGWPVNAYLIGPNVFRGDAVANWYAIRAVLHECQKRHLLTLTTGGEIHGLSEEGQTLATAPDKLSQQQISLKSHRS